jgi:FtsP/CotA-like multicopper oxidase with cupredoxin domain
VEIPAVLQPVPAVDTTDVAARRVLVMSQGQIDGKRMDMNRVDLHARLGTTEIWEVQNVVGMDHPFHLHGFHFQVLDRDGVPEPYRSWKDLVNVPKHSSVRIVVHFEDFPGKWMYHCHILDHEDEGMMGILHLIN